MTPPTHSERLFEDFCQAHSLACERIPRGPSRTPDYRLTLSGQTVIVEVKEFEPNPADRDRAAALASQGFSTHSLYPGGRVREEISKAADQLRPLAKGHYPGLIVFCDLTGPGAKYLDPYNILTAMYGVQVVHFDAPQDNPGTLVPKGSFFGPQRGTTPNHNTTVSAIARLDRDCDGSPCLDVFHNFWARIPLDPDLLRVPLVRHFVAEGNPQAGFTDWREV
jgi:hypothetical protein